MTPHDDEYLDVTLRSVLIPVGSTVGYGTGTDEATGREVRFVADARPLQHAAQQLVAARRKGTEVTVAVAPWQLRGEASPW